uniref:Si:dkey-12j5.1 n=1 Tax=Erpetoichthys calabaricus TaxID=27687 RepID=A0A8C4SWG2_ERPCA
MKHVYFKVRNVEENMDNCNFEMAQIFCQQALDLEPTNITILDMLGNIYAELGDTEKPAAYQKKPELEDEAGEARNRVLPILGLLVSVLGDYAESDYSHTFCSCSMEDGASDKCKEAIEKALQHDPDNPEALQLMASYLFSTEKSKEGKDFLMKSIAAWLPSLQKWSDDLSCENKDEEEQQDILQVCPPYESRVTTAKLLIEAEDYEVGLFVVVFACILCCSCGEVILDGSEQLVSLYCPDSILSH